MKKLQLELLGRSGEGDGCSSLATSKHVAFQELLPPHPQSPRGREVTSGACSFPGLVEQSMSVCPAPGAIPAPSVRAQRWERGRRRPSIPGAHRLHPSWVCTPTAVGTPRSGQHQGLGCSCRTSPSEEGRWGYPRRTQAGAAVTQANCQCHKEKCLDKGHCLVRGSPGTFPVGFLQPHETLEALRRLSGLERGGEGVLVAGPHSPGWSCCSPSRRPCEDLPSLGR